MKTIRSASASLLAAAGLLQILPAQDIKEIPVQPDPEGPLSMEDLLRRELEQGVPGDQEGLRQMIQEHARRQMLMTEPGKPDEGKPGWMIGVAIQPLPPFVREHLGLGEKSGARVSMVAAGSPAARAGLRLNDIILSANGSEISTLEQLKAAVEHSAKEGSTLVLETLRRGEKRAVSIDPPARDKEKATPEAATDRPAHEHRFQQLARRLKQQEREIERLKEEVSRLKRSLGGQREDDE